MAFSRIKGQDKLYVGGIWALRRADSLNELGITHVLSVVGFNHVNFKNFKDEPWSEYGKAFRHLVIDIDDVDEADLLIELPRAVRFIDEGLRGPGADGSGSSSQDDGGAALQGGLENLKLDAQDQKGAEDRGKGGAVFVHCAAGKSRSVSVTIAYLLWKYPGRFDPNLVPPGSYDESSDRRQHAQPAAPLGTRGRVDTAKEAVQAALDLIRSTRPMAEPNDGFMEQLELWWQMGCPADVETQPIYQRWAYKREVEQHVAVGQAPSRLRFEDEQPQPGQESVDHKSSLSPHLRHASSSSGTSPSVGLALRCKKCRRTLATAAFIQPHASSKAKGEQCPHYFIEPLSWMRSELEKGELSGRLSCPNKRCNAGVGRYDWKGIRCACGDWVTPGLSLQRAKVDEEVAIPRPAAGAGGLDGATQLRLGIRMPPGRGGNL
ncbi:hypothetical protein HIM_01187 [Hirsutella minnesotensis 3608]|nr:hypothetical protein HIM_01187 [Hirsutella minnesotensis 3608]